MIFYALIAKITERNKDEILKEQTERLTKASEENDRAEMLKAQRLHSSDDWEVEFEETEKLPNFREISYFKIGFYREVKLCSKYVELYGSKWPPLDTKIYLTISYYKPNDNYRTTEYYCLLCAKRMIRNWLGILDYDFLAKRRDRVKEKFPDLEFNKD